MKRIFSISVVVLPLLFVYHVAAATASKQTGFENGMVVSVDKHVTLSNSVADSPSDAPLKAEVNSYNVGIRVNCNLYVGRYESTIDYLPAVLTANHSVNVRLDKHQMYVSMPESDGVLKMGIESHKRLQEQACSTNS